ncbi:uncharacterized protein B0I36DRAFT_315915 [Microdochium trichocladiopsis]|uniref:NADH dehydrogenase [ubiquinone] 1 alpha subcomplex subunit n=1 Tax=Microdochium trichocladiopsis TaxID=1682393 RepID=A0A9P8YG49_9PEZI|nr:uncharacterized protein B0I36DRAFT_315915 [Microdochium trichocladiopsis]KAH7038267.1 hypothetical protein B0I36DRAFT_315915 [Microdochium trichocladiopsis]
MAVKPPGRILQAWYQWKSLRLPWRKKFLVGLDLRGNTYWEFRLRHGDPPPRITSSQTADDYTAQRFRRIVHPPSRSVHLSDVQIPPAWHQWLRYSRHEIPTLDEQRADVARQDRIRVLAAQADQRWEQKERLLDMPPPPPPPPGNTAGAGAARAAPAVATVASAGKITAAEADSSAAGKAPAPAAETSSAPAAKDSAPPPEDSSSNKKKQEEAPNPWKQASRGGPSEEWQPQAWSPAPSRRR